MAASSSGSTHWRRERAAAGTIAAELAELLPTALDGSPDRRAAAGAAPSGRRPGAQPGHEAHARALVPEAQVDHVVSLRPTRCRGCGAALRGADPTPRRQQVTELPVGPPTITEYQWHTLACERCGVATTARRPPGVPAGACGPRLMATVAVCTGVYHLSKRTTAGLLA